MEYNFSEEELKDLLRDTGVDDDDPIVPLGDGLYKIQVDDYVIITNGYGVREFEIAIQKSAQKLK